MSKKNERSATKKAAKSTAREEFVNSENGNKKLREKIWDAGKKDDRFLILLEPGCFDGGIIRWGKKKDGYSVVYDYEKTCVALAEDYMRFQSTLSDDDECKIEGYDFDAAYLDAAEWIDYNTIRSLPYMASQGIAPKIVYTDEEGKEQEA